MPPTGKFLVENTDNRICTSCGAIHTHATRKTNEASCGTPIAFRWDRANEVANVINGTVVPMPTANTGGGDVQDMVVVLDDESRNLPQNSGDTTVLATDVDRFVKAG